MSDMSSPTPSHDFKPRLVFVTASSLEEAQSLAQGILEERLAVCVNLLPGVESHYWWKGRLERSSEVLLMIKTEAARLEALCQSVETRHSYSCPEIVAVAPSELAPAYRAWWEEELSSS